MNAIHDKHMHDHQIFYMTCFEENMNTALYFNNIQLSKLKKQKEDFPIPNTVRVKLLWSFNLLWQMSFEISHFCV